ncbi:Protein of unknown function [Gryllus bimaculatus]|nr:Protein of unknown function [Gryllus bimaculatus]
MARDRELLCTDTWSVAFTTSENTSHSGDCVSFRKNIRIQSITWLGLGVYTMVLRNCSVQTDTNASVYAVILIYFYTVLEQLGKEENLWTLLGLDVPENHPNSSAEYWALPAVPIFMAVACLRFGILWIAEAIMLPVAVRAFLKDRTEEKWLAKSPSASGPGRSTPPVAAPWVTAGGGGDVVRRPGGGGRSPHGPDYQEINAPALEYLSVPADSQAWGGVRPRDPNWRDGGGGAPGGGLDRWNREGSGAGGGQPSRRHAPPPPLQLPQQTRDSTGSQPVQPSPARMGAWDPRSPLPAPGAQPPFFGAPPPTHTSFGHPPPQQQQQQQQQQHAPFR